jgi:PAS domain S-box-containing protein
MTEITDFNFAEDDFTAANLAKFELIKSEKEEDLNKLAELLNQIVAAKVAKLSQEKDEFYSKQLVSKELESDIFYKHFPCGYFSTSANGIITKINDTLLVWLGYAKEDIIAKVTWQSLLSVGGKIYFETHYSPLLQLQGFVQEISFEMVKKDKTRLPILINTKQIRDENGNVQMNYSTVFDVSHRKSYEKELLIAKRTAEDQNELIEYTFRNASTPIYYVLEDASIYDFNDIAAENLGYTSEELHTLKIYDLDINYDEKKWASVWAKLKANKKITAETQHKKKDGTLIDVIITANYVKYGDIELKCSYVQDITEKKEQEKELKLVDFTFNNSAMPIFLVKEDSSIYNINQAAAKGLGYSQEELKGKKIIEIDDNFDKEKWALHWSDVKTKGCTTIETTHTKKDGRISDLIININYLKHGDLELLCSYAIDITEKKKLEQQLNLLDYSYKHTNSAMFFLDMDGLFIDFNQATANLLGYSYEEFRGKTVFDVNPFLTNESWAKRWEELKDVPNQYFDVKLKRNDGTFIDVAVTTNSIELNDKIVNFGFYEDITEKKKSAEDLKLMNFAFEKSATPIILLSATGEFYSFNNALLNLLGYTKEEFSKMNLLDIATTMDEASCNIQWDKILKKKNTVFECHFETKDGLLLDVELSANLINYNENELNFCYVNDITEKKKAEDSLKLSAFTIDNAAWGLAYINADGTVYNCNLAFAKMYGSTSVEEMKTKTAFDFGTTYTPDTWNKYWEDLKQKKRLHYIVKRTKKDGTIIDVEINANMIQFGDLELNCVYVNDVTEKIKAEESLKLSAHVIQKATTAIYLVKSDGSIYNFNEAAYTMLGYTKEEFAVLNQMDLDPRINPGIIAEGFNVLRKKGNISFQAKIVKKGGELIDVEITSTFIVYDGLELKCSFITEITEIKRAEAEIYSVNELLKRQTNRLLLATKSAKLGIWDRDLENDSIFWDDGMYELYGIAPNEFKTNNEAWIARLHEEDREKILTEMQLNLTKKNEFNSEFRIVWSDSSIRYIKTTGIIERVDGKPIRIIGVSWDITAEKENIQHLKLLESVIVHTKDSILITEAEPFDEPGPRIIFVNPAFEKMTGYTSEEVIGLSPRLLQNEDTDRKELDKLRTAMNKWESCEITISNSRKNGEKFWNNFSIAPIANEKGWFTHWIAVERDVTKEIEAAIEKETLLQELVANNLELKQFSYITSHNLRAPLTNLVSICDIIQLESGTDPFTMELMEGFKTSTYHLNETLNDLIEVLIIKENRNIQKDQLTFEEIFNKISESLSMSLLEKKATINADFSAAPSVIFANAYLESVFLNLLTNSLKYRHPDRDPIITIKTIKEPNGDTKLTFADNGIGINMTLAKDKIFGLYRRFHNNADSKGIGLYLIHSQITTLGGKIEVESEVNIGTTFTITFK